MWPGHLRPGTAKAAAAGARRKLATRLSPEKPGRKRMAEITCVYDLTPVPRTIDDIVADLTADPAATSNSSTVTGTRRRPGPTGVREMAVRHGHRRHPHRHRCDVRRSRPP